MSEQTRAAVAHKIAPLPTQGSVLQRQCACGNHASGGGECESCKKKRESQAVMAQRKPHGSGWSGDGNVLQPETRPKFAQDFTGVGLRMAHGSTLPVVQTKLRVNRPDDIYELEADRIAAKVTSRANPISSEDSVHPTPVTSRVAQRQERTPAAAGPSSPTQRADTDAEDAGDGVDDENDEVEDGDDTDMAEPAEDIVQTKRVGDNPVSDIHAEPDVERYVSTLSGGQALPPSARAYMEPRFGHDFSNVRVHSDAQAHKQAAAVEARAFTVGRNVVFGAGEFRPDTADGQQLLAHELTHVVQQGAVGSHASARPADAAQSIQRKVVLKGATMTAKDRKAFLKVHQSQWRSRTQAKAIMEDMAAATDAFDFADEAELQREIVKRASTVRRMTESQQAVGDKGTAFGYPFSGTSLLYGPRVNYAAREYWTPAVVDDYARRTDKKKNASLRKLPRHERCTVYGDPCSKYEWTLTDKGKAEPYKAIVKLFEPQHSRKRSLLHCDYLISLVNFRSLADAIGEAEFNKRVQAFGPEKIILKWNAFKDLHVETFRKDNAGKSVKIAGIDSTQRMRPSSEADLILGDHVVFWNAPAYNLINRRIGNAWRLENAVLVEKNGKGMDVFLGHGSGRKTADEMNRKLVQEFNDVAIQAIAITERIKSPKAAISSAAQAEMADRFPEVVKVGAGWRVKGTFTDCNQPIDETLRKITPADVTGLKDPCDTTHMNWVERPIESAK